MVKIVKKTKAPRKEINSDVVEVSLALDSTVTKGVGATVLEALRAIPKPIKITTKSILTVTKGSKKHARGLTIPLAKRLFYPASQVYIAKNLELVMK